MFSFFKKYGIYFLVGVIGGITVMLFGLILRNNIEVIEIIKIVLSITALFSTFGGAYLGAKISGDNARKNMNTQIQVQKEENKRNEIFNRKRLSVEMKNNMLNDYLIQLNELDNILQNIEVETKDYLLFTKSFGEKYKEITEDGYFHYNKNKRKNDFHKIVTKNLEIEKQRNRVIMNKKISFDNNEDIPNIVINMLEPVVNIDSAEIEEKLLPTISSYLVEPNNIYSGFSDYLDFYNWIDKEKKQVIDVIKENLNSLKE